MHFAKLSWQNGVLGFTNATNEIKSALRGADFLEVNNYRQLTTIISICGLSRYRDTEDYISQKLSKTGRKRDEKQKRTVLSRRHRAANHAIITL